MNKTRYVLHPGYVYSKNDRQWHYIGAGRLAQLYGVPYLQCVVHDHENPSTVRGFRDQPGDVHLYPQLSGDYTLPKPPVTILITPDGTDPQATADLAKSLGAEPLYLHAGDMLEGESPFTSRQ